MQTIDWLWLIHPVLAVVVVYPLLGIVLRLAQQTRQRRLKQAKTPPTSGRDHADLGRWLATTVVAIELVALSVVIATKHPLSAFEGGAGRLVLLVLVLLGTTAALVLLWRAKAAPYRATFALLCWIGVIGLGMQPEVWRLSDNPLDPAFWQSHFWGGVGLTGLLLFGVAARPEILRSLPWRRLHLTASALAGLLLLAQGISGPRDLLEIPLNWQKPAIATCDFVRQVCPPLQPPAG
ncbi:DUF4079 domain-containing protein [Synechococcus sp. CBW1002]|jgi:hypothetical protein|uniref:DUF4079 domain-containing protein n=1 Tax=Synechococcus sp. CBW1002 TaxID=1353134 RepID=UPI0018CEDD35|nr:DUF4079 domain-containing protein [Synechococcus sp. CBW1002]QPN59389.1 DUF4079 domain-containing protein [Synechococcus sp. CBW1002]